MSQLDTKIDEFMKNADTGERPTFLYIGTAERWALAKKLNVPIDGLSGKKYQGLEIVLVCRQTFLEVG